MWFLTSHAIAGLVLTTLVSVSAATLDTKPVPPGTLSCVIGEAWIGSQPLNEKSGGSAALSKGQLLRTGNGTVEVTLASDVYMRLAKDSSVRIVSLKSINVGVEARQGQAIVEVGAWRIPVANPVLEHNATAQPLKKGLYEFDAEQSQFLVFKGEVVVQQGSKRVVAASGRRVTLNSADELSASKFNKKEFERADLYHFSSTRSNYLAEVNTFHGSLTTGLVGADLGDAVVGGGADAGRGYGRPHRSVGRTVIQSKPGDWVFSSCRGAFAEYACASESKVVLKPD